jgi:hypothetical protein
MNGSRMVFYNFRHDLTRIEKPWKSTAVRRLNGPQDETTGTNEIDILLRTLLPAHRSEPSDAAIMYLVGLTDLNYTSSE